MAGRSKRDRAKALEECWEILERSDVEQNRLRAIEMIGKLEGWFVDKKEIRDLTDRPLEDLSREDLIRIASGEAD